MSRKSVVLAVDDDATTQTFIYHALSTINVETHFAAHCQEFYCKQRNLSPDLYLIDVELPDGDGFDLTKSIVGNGRAPIIFFTVHAGWDLRLRALELGAVEFLEKPVHPIELQLRVKNLLSAFGADVDHGTKVEASAVPAARQRRFGLWSLDLQRRSLVDQKGGRIGLTGSEYELMAALTAAAHRTVSREELAEQLGPRSAARHNLRIVDVLVWRLRKKLGDTAAEPRYIVTVPSRGYVFAEAVWEQ